MDRDSETGIHDPLWRLTNLYSIAPKKGETKLFWHNRIQADVQRRWSSRIIVLKPRQVGISTFVELRNLDRVLWNPNTWCAIIAHEQRTLDILFNKIQFAWDNLVPEIKKLFPSPRTDTKHELFWRELNSKIYVSLEVRGGTNQIVHFSEYAQIDEERIAATLPTVPPDGEIIIESTPYGVGNKFHQEYLAAKSGDSQYQPFFYEWWWQDEYQVPVRNVTKDNLTFEEKALVENHGLRLEQIQWRRDTMPLYQRADGTNLFQQEYPEDDIAAFMASEDSAFDKSVLQAMRGWVEKRKKFYFIGFITEDKTGRPGFSENINGPLTVFEVPRKDLQYAAGLDISEGNPTGDWQAIEIIRRDTRSQVAEYRIKTEIGAFAQDAKRLCQWYNNCHVCPERNGAGRAFLNDFLDLYPHKLVYQEDEKIKIRKKAIGMKFGYYSGRRTKSDLIIGLQNFIRDEDGEIYSLKLIQEMMELQKIDLRKSGDVGVKTKWNKHDDLTIAFALALEMDRVLPVFKSIAPVTRDVWDKEFNKSRSAVFKAPAWDCL